MGPVVLLAGGTPNRRRIHTDRTMNFSSGTTVFTVTNVVLNQDVGGRSVLKITKKHPLHAYNFDIKKFFNNS